VVVWVVVVVVERKNIRISSERLTTNEGSVVMQVVTDVSAKVPTHGSTLNIEAADTTQS
jgi:hypothetical protein